MVRWVTSTGPWHTDTIFSSAWGCKLHREFGINWIPGVRGTDTSNKWTNGSKFKCLSLIYFLTCRLLNLFIGKSLLGNKRGTHFKMSLPVPRHDLSFPCQAEQTRNKVDNHTHDVVWKSVTDIAGVNVNAVDRRRLTRNIFIRWWRVAATLVTSEGRSMNRLIKDTPHASKRPKLHDFY